MNSSKKIVKFALSAALSLSMLLPSALALYPGQVQASSLYFRKTPGGEIISTLSQGTKIAILSNSTSWYKIAVNGQEGYVSGEYVRGAANGDFALGKGTVVCNDSVNLRSAPGTSSSIITSMKNGSAVTGLGVHKGWFKVSYNGTIGFMHPDYIKFGLTSSASNGSSSAVATSSSRQAILNYAAKFLGTPYVYGGSTPSGFDCSGFTSYVFNNNSFSIPRVAQSQFDATARVSMSDLLPGDLVFFGGSTSSISHVGIYTGNSQFIHSPHTGDVVKYDSLSGYYATRFQGGGRVINS